MMISTKCEVYSIRSKLFELEQIKSFEHIIKVKNLVLFSNTNQKTINKKATLILKFNE